MTAPDDGSSERDDGPFDGGADSEREPAPAPEPETSASAGADSKPGPAVTGSAGESGTGAGGDVRDRLRRIGRTLTPGIVRQNYLAKFLVSILLVVLVLSAVGGFYFFQAEAAVEDDARHQLTSAAQMHADSLGEWRTSMETHTRSVSGAAELAEGDEATAQSHVVQEQATLPADVRAIHVVDTGSGEIVTSTSHDLRGAELSTVEEPWSGVQPGVDLTSSNDVWHSPAAYESERLGDQVMAFASPVEGRESRMVVLVGTLQYRVENLHQHHDGQQTTILDANGSTVLGTGEGGRSPSGDVVDRLGGSRGGTAFERSGGDVVAYAATEDGEWIAMTTVPEGEAFAARDTVARSVIAIVAAGLFALLVVGVVLGRQTVVPLADLREKTDAMERGELDVDLESDRTDEIGRLYGGFASMRDALRRQIEEARAGRERVEAINEDLETTAEEYSTTLDAAADGDLSARVDVASDHETMQAVGEDVNAMLAEFERTVAELNRFATEVAAASEQVTSATEEVNSASEQVSESVQEISAGAERQNERLQTATNEMDELATITERIEGAAEDVATSAERTAETGHTGQEAAAEAIDGMEAAEATTTEAVEEMASLSATVGQIDELIDRIQEIAEQTNVLALNANIEASRSGASDEEAGFGVVAQEVKDLSDDAKEAATEVEDRLEKIREQTAASADGIERASERVDAAVDRVHTAADALEEIASHAEQTNEGIQSVADATGEQTNATKAVESLVEEAASISEETSAEAETVAASAEEQTTATTQVAQSASDLAGRAAQLSEALDRFETEVSAGGGPEGTAVGDVSVAEPSAKDN